VPDHEHLLRASTSVRRNARTSGEAEEAEAVDTMIAMTATVVAGTGAATTMAEAIVAPAMASETTVATEEDVATVTTMAPVALIAMLPRATTDMVVVETNAAEVAEDTTIALLEAHRQALVVLATLMPLTRKVVMLTAAVVVVAGPTTTVVTITDTLVNKAPR